MEYTAGRMTAGIIAVTLILVTFFGSRGNADPTITTWFAPNEDAPDYIDLFKQPTLWAKARSRVSVFKFSPKQVSKNKLSQTNTFDDLVSANAFRKLRSWGIDIAIEVGSVKEYDCNAEHTPRTTLQWISNVKAAGYFVRFLAMDEPIASGLDACKRTLNQIAKSTAAYVRAVRSANLTSDSDSALEIGDIEAYPATSIASIKQWILLLKDYGYKPAFFHLDVNIHYLDKNPQIDAAAAIADLKLFFRDERIPFGIIIWSGYDPLNADQKYYNLAIRWAEKIHSWIGHPDQLVIQSWVTRSSQHCELTDPSCNPKRYQCQTDDPPFCGKKSIPINLPENDPNVFSHTRLINDVFAIFAK